MLSPSDLQNSENAVKTSRMAMSSMTLPPEPVNVTGRQRDLLPTMVDQLACDSPDVVYGLWPIMPTSYEAGFRAVTYRQLANVVNGLAWWLVENLGPGQAGEALAYVGPNDVRLSALLLAAVKAGYTLFLASPRNSPAAHQALFDSLKCKTLVTPEPIPSPALAIIEAVRPRHLKAPGIEELLGSSYLPFQYAKTLDEGLHDPVMIIHTSGSTGLPKPLIWTHETVLRHQNASGSRAVEGIPSLEKLYLGKRVMVTVPPFHGAGLGQFLLYAIPFGNTVIAPAATAIVTAQGLVDALQRIPADLALLVPSVVVELAQNPHLLDYCAKHLELIVYIGGDLPQAIGDVVAAKMPLRCQWGASEVGMPQQLIPTELDPRTDWRYIRFHPCTGATFEEVADGTYELVIRRDRALTGTQTTFTIRGKEHLDSYRTQDLFAPHPTVPDTWSWKARADDIIVFLNGEKTNPVSMEQHIVSNNPELGGVIVIGAQRFQAALLIEPVDSNLTTAEQASLIERVWPSVEEANRVAPAHARVEKSLIFVTSPERPLIRAGKGTLQRAASLALYKAEIDKVYLETEDVQVELGDSITFEALDNAEVVAQHIRECVTVVTHWPSPDDSANFFERGMDSLQALQITRTLRRGFGRPDLGLSTVYQNPTVSQLATAILSTHSDVQTDRDIMEPLLATYTNLIHQLPVLKNDVPKRQSADVLLTGSTGALGTFILKALLERKGIGHIYCLNRGSDGGISAQVDRFTAHKLATSDFQDRVTFLQTDLAHPKLALDENMYDRLRTRVGFIIHNAWPVNFNLNLAAFRPQLAGVVNIFSLAAAATHSTRVLFISTVGTMAGRPGDVGPAPETILTSFDTPHASGYTRSKYLSELLCDAASNQLRIPTSIVRVGQVAGSVKYPGIWNPKEWFPSLVISSVHLGCLPENLGTFSNIDWVPSDMLSDVLVDLAVRPAENLAEIVGTKVFNLRNPYVLAWDKLIPTVQDVIQTHLESKLDVVAPSLWLDRLQKASEKDSQDPAVSVTVNPAIRLLSFYRDGLWADRVEMKPMSVEHTLAASSTLRSLTAVQPDWIRKWIQEWLLGL
ncbi:uncharacterized protein JN550_000426 [Neoarthrinium moseri]|uniref:uncharacterized protein n=1 Tax=Neoarthrinium moseri TaxID=1658444 RepID=UPI001FDC5F97|nr:uncharacterized protein JN550_000426 [Neoarthrinium moseri]KAI1878244.1 hypothetical protein JN550_000426 [Neoarthrinium moseri]